MSHQVQILCSGCNNIIEDKRYLTCRGCEQNYDLICANVSENRFYNTLTKEHRDAWRCVLCKSKQPKTDNSNTPVRSLDEGVTIQRGAALTSPIQFDMSIVEQPKSDDFNDTAHNVTMELSDMQTLLIEMRSFREEMREEIRSNRAQVTLLHETFSSLVGRVTECECRIEKIETRIQTLEQCLKNNGNAANKSLGATIEHLKIELNERDQELLMNDVEITCIPEQKGESISHIVTTLSDKLGVNLHEQDLVSAVRVGRMPESSETPGTQRPRPIVVRLARRAVRDQFLQAARVRRGATTEGLGLPGTPRRFYVNERLTKVNRQLFRQAREIGGRLNWRFVWTRDGKIFARQYHGKDCPRHRLRTDSDLTRVFGMDAVCAVNDNSTAE